MQTSSLLSGLLILMVLFIVVVGHVFFLFYFLACFCKMWQLTATAVKGLRLIISGVWRTLIRPAYIDVVTC